MTHIPPYLDNEFILCPQEGGQEIIVQCKTSKEAHERLAVVNEARTWIKTPYHHMGRVKGSGVDCATILAEVYPNAGVVHEKVQLNYYPLDWNLHQSIEQYLSYLTKYMHEIPPEEAKMGDVVLFKWGRCFAHGAIIIDPGLPHVIHADINIRYVVYGRTDEGRMGEADRDRRYYSPWP